MIFQSKFFILLILCLVFLTIIHGSLPFNTCPHLKPNKNSLVICYTVPAQNVSGGNLGNTRREPEYFRCDNEVGKVSVSTIAVYKCDKYYKPTARRYNGGKLNCTANGWNNLQAFRDFHCELDCGTQPELRNALIESGKPTNPKFWPWLATIYKSQGSFISYTCGGTLIGLRTLLTAAHCVNNAINTFKVILGSVSSDLVHNVEAGASAYEVKEIFFHPKFNSTTLENDIAIIELQETVNLTESILPVCLPISYEQDTLVTSPDSFGEIASFGSDVSGIGANSLWYMQAEVQTPATCYSEMKKVPTSDQYCAGSHRDGPNLCKGDSGSGMFFKYKDTNKHVIHGIVSSTGNVTNGCGPLVIFPKVYSYIEWIHEIMTATENRLSDIPVLTENQIVLSNVNRQDSNCSGTKCNSTGVLYDTPVEYSEDENQALKKLSRMLRGIKLEDYMYRDQYLIRFLRANEFNLGATKDALRANMEWREAQKINEIIKEDFTQFRKDYSVFVQGVDKEGRPIQTILIGTWKLRKLNLLNGEWKKFERYFIRCLEEQEARIRAIGDPNVSQSATIVDFHGFSTKEIMCPQCFTFFINLLKMYEKYYPQQSHVMYFINMPPFIGDAFNVLRPHISHYTLNHIKLFGPSKEIWSKELLKQIPSDQLYRVYGGTRTIQNGSDQIQLAL